MTKKLYPFLLTLGLLMGLQNPLAEAAFSAPDPDAIRSIPSSGPALIEWGAAEYSNEDNVEVPEIHSEHDDEEETIDYCVGVEHLYYYYNDSENTSTQEFRAPVYAFAIVLDSDYPGGTPSSNDFWSNIDTESMVCTDGAGTYIDCSFDKDTVSDGDLLYSGSAKNGTTIHFEELDWVSGSPRGLVWRYNTNDADDITKYPWLDPGEYESEGIIFEPEDYTTYQTATTESWAKVEYFSVHPDDRADIDQYENIYPIEVDTDEDGDDDVGVDPDEDYIYWYGLNGRLRTIWTPCEVGCAELTISPDSLGVDDVFNDTEFSLTATDTDGNDITDDVQITYQAYQYDGSAATGDIRYFGTNNYRNGNAGPFESSDTEIEYRNSLPGDRLTAYVSDYEGESWEDTCSVEIEFPYCADLDITDPSGFAFIASGDIDMPVEIEAEASTGEDWPYAVSYNSTDTDATFDGNSSPYNTDDWTIASYQSDTAASVWVELDDENGDGVSDDVAGLCNDTFTYGVTPVCESLEIIIPTSETLTCEEMSEEIEIRWESFMTSGAPSTGPWLIISSNPAGTFALTAGGPTVGTGSYVLNTPPMVIYYTGEDGDSIQIMDQSYPYCLDSFDSETCEDVAPVCEDLALGTPYILNDDGSQTSIDLTDTDDLETLYGESTVCWDFTLNTSDPTYAGSLIAEGFTDASGTTYSGNLSLTVNETATTVTGNPATTSVTGFDAYTGTLCWENFEAGNTLSIYMLGDEAVCSDEETLPELPPEEEAPVCVDLQMSPDSYTMSSTDADAGNIPVTISVQGSDASWTGTLVVQHTGTGALFYSDGSSSGYSDGHLEIPVSGTSTSVTVFYRNGHEGDVVSSYVVSYTDICADEFSISQDEQPPEQPEEEVCEEVDFTDEELQVDYNCEDVPDVELCVEKDEDDEREVEICYEMQNGEDGEWEYEGRTYEGCEEVIFNFENAEEGEELCADITFFEVCEGAEIEVREEVNGEEQVCEELEVEEVEMGTFEKFIFTFNFASEKNSYTDEGVFFSHDEDRAFYTLEYDPTGDEEAITFTDEMWGNDLEGSKGNGEDSGGTVSLATSYDELVKSAYNGAYDEYDLITNMGFGCDYDSDGDPSSTCREEYSEDIASYVASSDFQSNYTSFIAYVKYPSDLEQKSVVIPECEYDKDDNLESEGVCYDPEFMPEDDGEVVIENAGTVQEDYGVEATIRIRYVGVIDSGLDCGATDTDECLTEEFENHASVEVFEGMDELTDSARLVVLCSYLMTQNAGDVYLEVSLEGGSDIACIFVDEDEVTSSYRNVDSLIILEDDDDDEDEDDTYVYSSTYSPSTISFCDDDEDNLIGNLSSYVCEIVAKVTDLWSKSNVESTTEDRLSQATRNADTNQIASDSSYSSWDELELALTNENNPGSNILYFDGSLSTDGKLTLGSLTVPEGAWTIIVKDADLELTGNIQYAGVSNPADYKDLPSVAFVVEDGDIYIQNSALKLVGVYYTNQKFDGDERSAVDEQLTVDGSFYGNIQTLIQKAKYVGPPTIDGGGIVIRYDSRILLNTPPALSEYVDINTEKGVN